ncbi:hypothetical protein N9917_04045 [Deltaproteobacteria bacterium]|nr:hypothetical protein [Deltaproteobacteria bacterium]
MNKIEEAARGVCIEVGVLPDEYYEFVNDHKRKVKNWEMYIDVVKAVLKTMRDASKEQIKYGSVYTQQMLDPDAATVNVYQAMIDRVLEGGE